MKTILLNSIKQALFSLYSIDDKSIIISIEKTREGFTGDFTFVVFPILQFSKKKTEETANEIGSYISKQCDIISSYNIVKGFLNISIKNNIWISELNKIFFSKEEKTENKSTVMIEFSSPNTNKPLHLGHIRNNLLGDSISRIIEKDGNKVIKVNLINDRGIHICKSMLAWIKWGNGATPESTGIKGDKFVGDYYVLFNDKYKKQIEDLIKEGKTEEEAKNAATLLLETRELLRKWENNDTEIIKIWNLMNSWVYQGFEITYKNLGISFDKIYYESQTYLLGKSVVTEGLEKGIFVRDTDNSVWIDLTNEGLDRKILLRSDGTTVYITQDIGTVLKRFEEYNPDKLIYVVGDEQNYHFEVLKKIISKIDPENSEKIKHLSYGMVELPDGKMKSREGTVVDADDLIENMIQTAEEISETSGKINELESYEKNEIIHQIALGALKYYILKIDPKKQIIYNPKESIDFNGNTGPFIQYTFARIESILKNAEKLNFNYNFKLSENIKLSEIELKIISELLEFKNTIHEAAEKYNPGIIANYIFELAKNYNQFYHDNNILKETNRDILHLRLILSKQVSITIKESMNLLGIKVPNKM
ncbi:MAG: arginine--tRNA ligase [Bacteroidales bacterium]|jgi:arginyl-tRNA synthetase|nr:arginine--tRNA ligase [Bacteroidales bacterium]